MEDEQKLIQILDFLESDIVKKEELEELELPEKLKPLIAEIAGSIDAGLVCFLNPETLEIDAYPAISCIKLTFSMLSRKR